LIALVEEDQLLILPHREPRVGGDQCGFHGDGAAFVFRALEGRVDALGALRRMRRLAGA